MIQNRSIIVNNLLSDFSPKFLAGGLYSKKECDYDWIGKNKLKEFYKFYFAIKGSYYLKFGEEKITPSVGELFLVPANTKHDFSDQYDDVELYWCHFESSVDLFSILNKSVKNLMTKTEYNRTTEILETLVKIRDDNSISASLLKKSCLIEILSLFFDSINLNIEEDKESSSFRYIVHRFILEQIHRPITVEELSALVSFHPVYFIRVFKSIFLTTPIKYINLVRLENAAKLLLNEDEITIEAISEQSGFSDYRYFSRIFKKNYGVSPSEYRKSHSINQ